MGKFKPSIPSQPTAAQLEAEAAEEARQKRAELEAGRTKTILTDDESTDQGKEKKRRTLVGG